jgi:cytochrome P450
MGETVGSCGDCALDAERLDVDPEQQARLWVEAPTRLLEKGFAAHGGFFLLELGRFGRLGVIAAPEGVRAVFGLDRDIYECRPFNEGYRYAMGDNALFLQDGAAHGRLKRILAPSFREAALGHHERVVAEEARAVLQRAAEGETLRLRRLTHEIALRSLLRLVLGRDATLRARILAVFRVHIWRDLRAWKPWTALSRQRATLLPLLAAALAERRAAPEAHDDLLSRLAAAHDSDGTPLSDGEILDQIMMLTITAGDAVAVAAAWALERLARHPEVQGLLRNDADGIYLSAACKETLRLHPVLPTVSGRRLTRSIVIMGRRVDAGVTLAPCEYLVHRRADLFDDPLTFRPERFLDRSYPPDVYFPFGGADRACLGGALAPMTIRAVMAAAVAVGRLDRIVDEPPRTVRQGTLLAPAEDYTIGFRAAFAHEGIDA